jgi:hypothetical protein
MSEEEKIPGPQSTGEPKDQQALQQDIEMIPAGEPVDIDEPQNTNKPQTDLMEVHQHSHISHSKKNWKSYFWEFLMLFLAVFCGFLAEYQLEHKIERDRELKFIQTFIEDLELDTTAINRNLVFQQRKRMQLDSLTSLLRDEKIKGYENELYYLGRVLVRTTRFQSSDRTITQLKYSGSLRLIRNENAADSIMSYHKLVDYILQNVDDERIERRSADPLLAAIYDPFVFDSMLDEFNNVNKPVNNPPLRSYDRALQQDFAYCINLLKGSNIIISTRLRQLKDKATNIIAFLKDEYHL